MTTASSIIRQAYRESNLLTIGGSLNTAEVAEGLNLLNSIIASTLGFEVSDSLRDLNIGGDYDESNYITNYVPVNSRLVCNLDDDLTVTLPPAPNDGDRFAVVDVADNFASNSLTIDPNGRQIEGVTTLTLSTNGYARQWMYRADLGEWVAITTLAEGDTMPFPVEFDDYFSIMLAIRLNPRHSAAMASETVQYLARIRKALQSRYHCYKELAPDVTPLTGDYVSRGYDVYDFNTGRRNWGL